MKPYNDYNTYLKAKYGTRVYRIGIDAGFSCPNRDGTKGSLGCIYCNADGSRAPYADPSSSVGKQLETRIAYLKNKGIEKFIAYFQAFSNTYGAIDTLNAVYDEVLPFHDVVGISIGTRPDAIDKDKLKLIASYSDRFDVWIEYGLQSANDMILRSLNRAHTYDDFAKAVLLTKEHGIKVCAHIIMGIPGEGRGDVLYTARKLAELNIDGIKLHVLHILKGSALEGRYREGAIKILDEDEYVELVCDVLENIPKEVIVQRLTGQGTRRSHIAPQWALNKTEVIRKIEASFNRRGTCQGARFEEDLKPI